MDINDDAIKRFLNRECDPVEAEQIAAYLQQHPHLLGDIYHEAEWNQEPGAELSVETWDAMWTTLKKERRQKAQVRRLVYAAAACISALIVYSYFLRTGKDNTPTLTKVNTTEAGRGTLWKNEADTTMHVLLADGTQADLLPHGTIRYNVAAWNKQREVFVEGEAVFHVAKDKVRPFIAYCDGLSVQALGTVFSLKRALQEQRIHVRLFEGKVLVKPYAKESGAVARHFSTILAPGQELILPLDNHIPYVQYFLRGKDKEMFVKKETGGAVAAPLVPSGWYEFTSQPVSDVFSTLEVLYGVHIRYSGNTVKDMFFIGRFEPRDSVEDVLQAIALLNNLNIEKRARNYYIITKSNR